MIVTDDPARIDEVRVRALEERLYVRGWSARDNLAGVQEIHAMSYEPGVGWVMVADYPKLEGTVPMTMAFVAEGHRRRGHARRLLEALRARVGELPEHGHGTVEGEHFWAACFPRREVA